MAGIVQVIILKEKIKQAARADLLAHAKDANWN
jgi:hypothetical protein